VISPWKVLDLRTPILAPVLVAVSLVAMVCLWYGEGRDDSAGRLVVYCAHDAIYAEAILREFEQRSGIWLDIRYDTEATKSLGLTQLIEREAAHPQADVFWNNELLGMLDLQQQGLLQPYRGAGWSRIPAQFRDADGHWVGFGARLRVWIVQRKELAAEEQAIADVLELEPARVAMAVPMFGTTLTHYTVLAKHWGVPQLQDWRRDLLTRGLREVPGNGLVKDLVSAGSCDAGWTDTDDTFLALDAGATVEMLPIRINNQTIVIPNTVAIIRGTSRTESAQQLVDFLTSAKTELRLANSAARQIPLGPVDAAALPDDVRPLLEWVAEGHDLRGLLETRQAVLAWLRQELAP
jgi:iron(III) transport system substrate-binding protein